MRIQKKKIWGGGGGFGLGGVKGGCVWRCEAFVKIQKNFFGGGGGGGQGGCEQRSKVFVKIQKKNFLRGGGGVGRGWGGVRSGIGVGEVGVARFGLGG